MCESAVGLTEATLVSPFRLCSTCSEEIPAARLKVVPNARQCVRCLTKTGDVQLIRRFDEGVGGDTTQTYFTTSRPIQHQIVRVARHTPSGKLLAEMTESASPVVPQVMYRSERNTGEEVDT